MDLYGTDERTPLLRRDSSPPAEDDAHGQFCFLVGVPPSDLAEGAKWKSPERSLYARATRQRRQQSFTYQMTAATSNFLLLSQLVLSAAVTGFGALNAGPLTITLLGAANTIIAGLVAYLKSRGQPMRARMFRDDLERVVDDIENSEIMWLGISKNMNGYDDIDTDDQVTVRSEVARLTRLYEKAVRTDTLNSPDMYGNGDGNKSAGTALKNRDQPAAPGAAAAAPVTTAPESTPPAADAPAGGAVPAPVPGPIALDPDESPATAKPTPPSAIKVTAPSDEAKDGADKDKTEGDEAKEDGDAKKSDDETKDDAADKDKKPATSNGNGDSDGKDKDATKLGASSAGQPLTPDEPSDEESDDDDDDGEEEQNRAKGKGKLI